MRVLFGICLVAVAYTGCGHQPRREINKESRALSPPTPTTGPPIRFENVAQRAGIHFALGHNGKSPLTILETGGGGCAFLDYDQDGWPDILLVGPHNLALYHNQHNGTFKDVTAGSGLEPNRYWMGCTVGDYDGDGLPDIFITGYRCFALYRNLGGGRFKDVTRESGIAGLDWSMSAVFADLTGAGRLDLFVSQYIKFDESTLQICQVGAMRSACGPEIYSPIHGKLFVNVDGRHFRSSAWSDSGKTWGALATDLFGNGQPALYLANDMVPGDLYVRGSRIWRNVGSASGTANDFAGRVQGGMGIDSGDYDNDGRLDLLVTTYFMERASLYHNDGNGIFSDGSVAAGLDGPTMPYVKFGCAFSDFDNDGWLDIVIANGHVRDNVRTLDASQNYRQPVQLFRNNVGRFEDLSPTVRNISPQGIVGRGLAIADFDRDGRLDVLICDLEGVALLLHNVSPRKHWLTVRLSDTAPNRHGLGALLTLHSANGVAIQEIKTGGGVLSARDAIAHFGLGDAKAPVKLTIRWPDGARQDAVVAGINREIVIRRDRTRH